MTTKSNPDDPCTQEECAIHCEEIASRCYAWAHNVGMMGDHNDAIDARRTGDTYTDIARRIRAITELTPKPVDPPAPPAPPAPAATSRPVNTGGEVGIATPQSSGYLRIPWEDMHNPPSRDDE